MVKEKKEKKKFLHKLTHKYRLVLYNDSTFEETGYVRLTRLNVFVIGTILFLIFVGIFWSLIAYTPIREMIPGYPDAVMRSKIIQTKIRLDSLEQELAYRDQYFSNLNRIISGEETEDFLDYSEPEEIPEIISLTRSTSDSLLRKEMEMKEMLSLNSVTQNVNLTLEKMHFFAPVRGMVTKSFDPLSNHYGTDVGGGANEVVKATLDGTVVLADWTVKTGNVIQIQHDNNLISVYKHNAELLKKVGMRVRAGDAIAIMGNSGELTTGPHLHFEIWQNGIPLNPEDFIVF